MAVIATAACSGALMTRILDRADRQRHPAPGRHVDVRGYPVHVLERGHGGPTVVLDSGLGGCNLEWREVMQVLSSQCRVVHVDRLGLGWSALGHPGALDLEGVVADLRGALSAAGIGPPYVLVGHSLGGIHVRAFAHLHPDEVAGVVLVDPTNEDPGADHAAVKRTIRLATIVTALARALGHLGTAQLLDRLGVNAAQLPLAQAGPGSMTLDPVIRARYRSTSTLAAIHAEFTALPRRMAALRRLAATPLPDVPWLVLSAGRTGNGHPVADDASSRRAHRRMAALVPRGRVQVIDAPHFMMATAAGEVAAAILAVVRSARRPAGLERDCG